MFIPSTEGAAASTDTAADTSPAAAVPLSTLPRSHGQVRHLLFATYCSAL